MYAKRKTLRGGFTLIEAALTTMIVGVGLVATLQLLAAGTTANVEGTELTTGMNLAKNIRELTLKSTFDEVRAMHGQTYTPPRDSRGQPIAGFGGWTQTVNVQPVDLNRLTTAVIDPDPDAVLVTVSVSQNGEKVCGLSWHRFKPRP